MSTYRSTQTRTNNYPTSCAACRSTVPAAQGSLTRENGRWVVRHLDACPTPAPVVDETPYNDDAPVESPLAALTPGWRFAVETGEGENGQPVRFFRVSKVRRNGSVFVDQQVGPNTQDAAVVRADGSVFYRDNRVRPYLLAAAADPEAAGVLWSKHHNACFKCALTLTDWVSRALSQGPVCDPRDAATRKALALATGATPDDEG